MQFDPEILGHAERALKRFRLGGIGIAVIPLIFAFIQMIGPRSGREGLVFGIMSICITLTVVWTVQCGERFLKAIREGVKAPSSFKQAG